ncbi:MAG: sigma-70 family RNA polymerase sigma factor [Bacteroidota bacterium]
MAKRQSDQDLIHGIKSGGKLCEEAMRVIYAQYVDEAVSYLTRRSFQEEEARDVVQDAVINLLMNIQQGKFQGNSSLKTYLFAISKNLWLRKLRRQGVEESYLDKQDKDAVDTESPEVLVMGDQKKRDLQEIMGNLKEKCLEVLSLWSQKYAMKEIAEQLGYMNEQVVRNKKNHCMKELKELVRQNPEVRRTIQEWIN